MRAEPNDFRGFKSWLESLAVFGSGQSVAEASFAELVLTKFQQAEAGIFARKCCCGQPGEVAMELRPAQSWALRSYVFCAMHGRVVREYLDLMDTVMEEHKREFGPPPK